MNDLQEDGRLRWVVRGLTGLALIAVLVAVYSIGYNNGRDKKNSTPQTASQPAKTTPTPPAAAGEGKQIFIDNCGGCHTLKAAGTTGTGGPDLGSLRITEDQVVAAIKKGGTGAGGMPKNLVSGQDAQHVADFIASVSGG